MASRRSYGSYDDGCAAAHALDLVGERWALIVVRELILGPKRFTDLRNGVLGASPTVLAQRLRELEEVGVVHRRVLAPPFGTQVYELTDWGRELEPVLQTLGRWGVRSPSMPHGAQVGPETSVLSMRTMYDREAISEVTVQFELRLGDETLSVDTAAGFDIERGSSRDPEAIVTTAPVTWTSIVFYGRDLREAIEAGDVTVEGEVAAVDRFLTLFPALGTDAP